MGFKHQGIHLAKLIGNMGANEYSSGYIGGSILVMGATVDKINTVLSHGSRFFSVFMIIVAHGGIRTKCRNGCK